MFERSKSENRFNRTSKRTIIIVALLLCAVILLIPFPTTVVPEWKITVVDTTGKPFANWEVRQYWQHYSLEREGHRKDKLTDGNGYVVFPERRIWSPLLWRIVSTSLAALEALVAHGSIGIDAWIMVYGYSTGGGTRTYKPSEPLPNEIIIQRIE
jgi:hypothetical protein